VLDNEQLISVMRNGSGKSGLFKFQEFLYEEIEKKLKLHISNCPVQGMTSHKNETAKIRFEGDS
jgi:hypothetical protein